MRWPSWRSCSKSAEASATRSVSSSFLRLDMKTGMRSSRSRATVTLQSASVICRIIGGAAGPNRRARRSGFVSEGVARPRQMGMERQRRGEGVARLAARALAQQDLGEMQHRCKMARLELERALDVAQAFGVPAEEVVEGGALVPGLRIEGRGSQERREARLGDVVAPSGDVPRRRLESRGRAAGGMVHPHA